MNVFEIVNILSYVLAVNVRLRTAPLTFRADHPFMFYIRDKVSETVLFSGRITNFD